MMYYYESDAIVEYLDSDNPSEKFYGPDIAIESIANIDGCKINSTKDKFVFYSEEAGISTEITEETYNSRIDGGSW